MLITLFEGLWERADAQNVRRACRRRRCGIMIFLGQRRGSQAGPSQHAACVERGTGVVSNRSARKPPDNPEVREE